MGAITSRRALSQQHDGSDLRGPNHGRHGRDRLRNLLEQQQRILLVHHHIHRQDPRAYARRIRVVD